MNCLIPLQLKTCVDYWSGNRNESVCPRTATYCPEIKTHCDNVFTRKIRHTVSLPEDESFTKTMSEAQDAKSDP